MQTDVQAALPDFVRGLFGPVQAMPRPWENQDASKLLTAITFAGLGGFWILFYSYWLRDKGAGMAGLVGRITGLGGAEEAVLADGFLPEDEAQSAQHWRIWRRFLSADIMVGIIGNLFTTLMTCLLAYALLFPKGLLPQEYELAVVQSQFFAVSWGEIGRLLFLVVAAAFLTDTWLATADAVSRIQTDIIMTLFPSSRKVPARRWYYLFLALLTVITSFTMQLDAPGPLILLSALIGFIGTILFPVALYLINHRMLPPHLPEWARPKGHPWLLGVSFLAYLTLAVLYLKTTLLG
jgi:hypothetical protein